MDLGTAAKITKAIEILQGGLPGSRWEKTLFPGSEARGARGAPPCKMREMLNTFQEHSIRCVLLERESDEEKPTKRLTLLHVRLQRHLEEDPKQGRKRAELKLRLVDIWGTDMDYVLCTYQCVQAGFPATDAWQFASSYRKPLAISEDQYFVEYMLMGRRAGI